MACSLSNTNISFELPIYWTQHYKTKADKTVLVGMNFYRNAHHHAQNSLKKHFHELVIQQLSSDAVEGLYRLHLKIYYKNATCDGSNVAALIEKFALDALQSHNTVVNDNVKFHIGTTWEIAGQDKTNPRCIVTVNPE